MSTLLGFLLVEDEKISSVQLAEALQYQDRNGGKLGEVLVSLDIIDRETIDHYLARQLDLRKKKG